MKKGVVAALIIAVFMITACATVRVEAPAGADIKLAKEASQVNYIAKKRVFYVLWGLVPVTDNSTAKMIRGKNVKEMRVLTYYDPVDVLVSYFLSWLTIHSKTVEIQAKTVAK
ncbi:MAG TPA: hypothetical protein ENG67_01580 [candidate division WOR-3 bacterium]|uniref:Uncharacterized protein n=1 Tax=candidate division WOR-3 bacterium TaxID=2052148 RepID=A0A7C1BDJ5_UNCW3|nr:hypothetical protein [candidate division WOR-3 bacterium]